MLRRILRRISLFNPIHALNNPFRGVLGPDYAPHAPTLNSSLYEKFENSEIAINKFLMNFINLPFYWIYESISLVRDIIDTLPVLNYLLYPVTMALDLANYLISWIPTIASFFVTIASLALATASLVVTIPVHLISNAIYDSKVRSAEALSGKIEGDQSGKKLTLADTKEHADDATLETVTVIRPNYRSDTCYISREFSNNSTNKNAIFASEGFDIKKAVNNPTTPTEIAAHSLFSLDPNRDIASKLPYMLNGYNY